MVVLFSMVRSSTKAHSNFRMEKSMSAESFHQNRSQERSLRDEEKGLLGALLSNRPDSHRFAEEILIGKVIDMSDGGMGSVKFVVPAGRSWGMTLVEADYLDEDGVLVSIAVNADDLGGLYEVDFWKADFSPLKKFPRPELVKIRAAKEAGEAIGFLGPPK
ncbi:MAG: hypothetical protein JOY84_09935 [Curvibacter sp.]|nr:hypothetical protein [Curvibacter sp.]